MKGEYDVAVIGAGVVGSAIARELSRYKLKIGVFEKNLDVCNETSGRNSAVVHGGFAYDADTLKARFCVAGNRMMGDLSEELDFPFKRCGKVSGRKYRRRYGTVKTHSETGGREWCNRFGADR